MQMTYSVFFTVESYRLWFCKISNMVWKSCRTQTGWEGQQRVQRTMSSPTRAARDTAQDLGKKPAWGTWGSLNLPGIPSATPQHPHWEPGQNTTPHFNEVKNSVKKIKVHLHRGSTEKNERETHTERTQDRTVSQCSFCLTFKWTGNDLSTNDYKTL